MGRPVGRSVAEFYLAGLTEDGVLSIARGLATEQRLGVETSSPNEVSLVQRGTLGGRRFLLVRALNAHGGVNMHLEAWTVSRLFGELNVNSRDFTGLLAGRSAWRLASTFTARLGITRPESVFRHT